jgi:hypothetical protein
MAVESFLVVLSLISFAALIVIWIAAPLNAEDAMPSTTTAPAADPAHTTFAA